MRDKIAICLALLFPATCMWFYWGAIFGLLSATQSAIIIITLPLNIIVSIIGTCMWFSPRLGRW
jgi:hypothetical protein